MTPDACAVTQLLPQRVPPTGDRRIGRRRYDGAPTTQASARRVRLHVEDKALAQVPAGDAPAASRSMTARRFVALIPIASVAAAVVGWGDLPCDRLRPRPPWRCSSRPGSRRSPAWARCSRMRVPGNRIGWLLLTAGVMVAAQNLSAG